MSKRLRRMEEKFTAWYDRQSLDVLFLLGVSPMIVIAVVLTTVALIWGRDG